MCINQYTQCNVKKSEKDIWTIAEHYEDTHFEDMKNEWEKKEIPKIVRNSSKI